MTPICQYQLSSAHSICLRSRNSKYKRLVLVTSDNVYAELSKANPVLADAGHLRTGVRFQYSGILAKQYSVRYVPIDNTPFETSGKTKSSAVGVRAV